MKYLWLVLLWSFSALAVSSQDVLGIWWSPEQKTKVEIYQEGDKFYGKIIAVRPESKNKMDAKNEDKSKRNQKILGLLILKDFKFKEDRWVDGKIYDPENGKTYKSILWFGNNKDMNTLNVRGYIGFALIGRTAEFKKVLGLNPSNQQPLEPVRYYGEE